MIPILYERDETTFSLNGLGRLYSCISAVVSEERNGIYECNFEYPISADNFNEIQVGRIIGVTHDDTGDVQPFDIVSYTRPINGVVTFHCTHISYRQSYLTVTGSGINSLAGAFALLGNATPSNPFTYTTDKAVSGYMAAADGIPKTVRSLLGGTEGSILDTYGGEYEWDRWSVKLHSARGTDRDFSIRYGVNMTGYEEQLDIQGTYSSVVPYWTDGTNKIIGNKQSNGTTLTGRGECVPLDVSDKFESKPTKAQVNSKGLSVLKNSKAYMPTQTIHVEFVRLQNLGYSEFENLFTCRLCDTVNVIFPFYNTESRFKIVKTEWNVLADRYESMELGDLSTTLSEALGISEKGNVISQAWAETVDAKLQHINDVFGVSCPANGSVNINVPDGSKYIIFGIGLGSSKMVALVNATASGDVSYLKVAGATNMTLSTTTNKVTINNGYGGAMSILVVDYRANI